MDLCLIAKTTMSADFFLEAVLLDQLLAAVIQHVFIVFVQVSFRCLERSSLLHNVAGARFALDWLIVFVRGTPRLTRSDEIFDNQSTGS